jgi:hypothetical protein
MKIGFRLINPDPRGPFPFSASSTDLGEVISASLPRLVATILSQPRRRCHESKCPDKHKHDAYGCFCEIKKNQKSHNQLINLRIFALELPRAAPKHTAQPPDLFEQMELFDIAVWF